MSSYFLISFIPLPSAQNSGFNMKIGFFLFSKAFNTFERSYGRQYVYGKKLYSFGNLFYILCKFLARLFFLAMLIIPGK